MADRRQSPRDVVIEALVSLMSSLTHRSVRMDARRRPTRTA